MLWHTGASWWRGPRLLGSWRGRNNQRPRFQGRCHETRIRERECPVATTSHNKGVSARLPRPCRPSLFTTFSFISLCAVLLFILYLWPRPCPFGHSWPCSSKADLSSSPTRRLPCTRGPASCRLRHTWPGPGAAAAARPPAASASAASAATGGGAGEVSLIFLCFLFVPP